MRVPPLTHPHVGHPSYRWKKLRMTMACATLATTMMKARTYCVEWGESQTEREMLGH